MPKTKWYKNIGTKLDICVNFCIKFSVGKRILEIVYLSFSAKKARSIVMLNPQKGCVNFESFLQAFKFPTSARIYKTSVFYYLSWWILYMQNRSPKDGLLTSEQILGNAFMELISDRFLITFQAMLNKSGTGALFGFWIQKYSPEWNFLRIVLKIQDPNAVFIPNPFDHSWNGLKNRYEKVSRIHFWESGPC